MQVTFTHENLQKLADQVRRDVVDFFGLTGQQAQLLVGCCGEVSHRLVAALKWQGQEAWPVLLEIDHAFGHTVVVSGSYLLDASISQFAAEDLRKLSRPLPTPQRYVFHCPGVSLPREDAQIPWSPWVGDYPVGPITGSRIAQLTPLSIAAGRGYIVRSFATRFSNEASLPGGIAGLSHAAGDADAQWRMAAAAILAELRPEEGCAIARQLSDDSDETIRGMARRILANQGGGC